MNYPSFKVIVRCFTYNQSKYIVDAMNGFTMQQTDFPYVCCIADDASTDGEQKVLHEYMEANFAISDETVAYQKETEYAHITYAPHKTNKNCYFAVLYLKENHYSNPQKYRGKKREYLKEWTDNVPYEAICEGDDYWIDPLKLQKQVDVMENDSSVAMVYTKAKLYNQSKQQFVEEMGANTTFEELLCNFNNAIPTASVIFRTKCDKEYQNEINPQQYKWKMGDYPFNLYLTMKYRVFMIDSLSVVYRIVANSASHNQNEEKLIPYYKSIFDIKKCFFELVSGSEDLRVRMCRHYLGFAYKLSCRVSKGKVNSLINEVYSYMQNPTFYEKIILKMVTAYKCPTLIKKVIAPIYVKMNF